MASFIPNMVFYFMTMSVMIIIASNYATGSNILGNPYAQAMYAVSCFTAWLKLFYLMGMFRDFAYFGTVIYEIIMKLYVFIIMLAILMFAFTNFFYVIDNKENYIERYWVSPEGENSVINSLITTYLISLGEFSFDGYGEGPDRGIVWIFFILATFVMLIVFMNLLI